MEFYVVSNHIFSFVVFLPFSKFFFTHHMDPIIEEAEVSSDSIDVQVYDLPPSCAYVHLLEAELTRTKEALA